MLREDWLTQNMFTDFKKLQNDLNHAYTNFIQIATQLEPEQRQQPGVCGDWSPQAVVAHLAGWDADLCSFITAPDAFSPPADVDQFNADSVSSRQHLTWAESVDELQTGFQALLQALGTVSPEMKIYDWVSHWLGGRRRDYDLHAGQLKEWIT